MRPLRYDLRSQPADGLCPECGLSVEQTKSVGTHLQRGRPAWLNRLSLGTWMLLLAPIAAIIAVPLFALITVRTDLAWLTPFAPFSAALVYVSAIVLLTSREHRFEHQLEGNSLRVALRLSGFGALIIAGCVAGLIFENGNAPWDYIAGGSFLLLIPIYVLAFVYLRTLARRIGHASLAEHCVIVSVGISVSIILPMLIPIFAFYFNPANTLWPILIMLVTICLFALWSAYLLLRFAIVFHKSARIARRNWFAADAAANGRAGVPS